MPKLLLRRRSVLMGGAAIGLLPFATSAFASGVPDARRNHALLVAVTQYPHLFRSEWLEGPNNDAQMMREYLLSEAPVPFAPDDIRILATGLEDATAEPTLSEIRAEMARLAEVAAPGDFVLLHFGGHGIEQPARFPDQEVDGLDQVFMPKDVRRMTAETRQWPNGYVDKDIKDDITAIRSKGAFVWAIFDCCHSGTITRALDAVTAGEVSRKVDLRRYDIPADMWTGARSRSLGAPDLRPQSIFGAAGEVGQERDMAPLVAFFAAQTTEETPELPLPLFSENAEQMGLFSFTLLTKLRENPNMSFRQLGQSVHHAYLGMNRARPSPLFEGALDDRVFQVEGDLAAVRQWRIAGTGDVRHIPAGELHLLAPGARLAILADPGHDLDQALGMVEILTASALRSQLGPVSEDADIPALALADIPDNAYARLVEGVVDMTLRVATPDPALHPQMAEAVQGLLDAIASDIRLPARFDFVGPNSPADLRLIIRSEAEILDIMAEQGAPDVDALRATSDSPDTARLWLLDNSATLSLRATERPFSRPIDMQDLRLIDSWLRASLVAVFRATNLARLAQFDDFGGGDVDVQVTRLPQFMSPLTTGSGPIDFRLAT